MQVMKISSLLLLFSNQSSLTMLLSHDQMRTTTEQDCCYLRSYKAEVRRCINKKIHLKRVSRAQYSLPDTLYGLSQKGLKKQGALCACYVYISIHNNEHEERVFARPLKAGPFVLPSGLWQLFLARHQRYNNSEAGTQQILPYATAARTSSGSSSDSRSRVQIQHCDATLLAYMFVWSNQSRKNKCGPLASL